MRTIKNRHELDNPPIESRAGFYVLCLSRPIPKIKDSDPKGILYIGKSENLANRLVLITRDSWREKLKKRSKYTFDHSALTFIVDFEEGGNLIPHHKLICNGIVKEGDTLKLLVFYSDKAKLKEKKLLDSHVFKFGQLPPFNSQGSSLKSIGESNPSMMDQREHLNENLRF